MSPSADGRNASALVPRRPGRPLSAGIDIRSTFAPTLLVVAAVYGLLLKIALAAGLFGIWLAILVTLSLWRFAYAVLHDVARGRRDPPAPGPETANPVQELSLVLHAGLYLLLTWLFATTPFVGEEVPGEIVRWLCLGIVLAVFPASAAVMGITGNIAAAMNPFAFGAVIRVLGGRYLALMAACAALTVSATLTVGALGSSGVLTSLLGYVVSVWAFLALFALIGAAICAQRADFDLITDSDAMEARDVRDRERAWESALHRAYASIRSGHADRGYDTIRELIAAERDSLDVYDWIFSRMLLWEDRRHGLALAERFVGRLAEEKRYGAALELIDQCRALDAAFRPPAASAAALSAYARTIGRPRLADELATLLPSAAALETERN